MELATMLKSLGSDALTAFIIYQILDTLEVLLFFGLTTWGIRAAWRTFKKYEWGE